jgi:tetratricopeptide (TPR) repeat protein
MVKDHPKAVEFERFLRNPLGRSREVSSRVIRHLLADCSLCRTELTAIGWPEERLARLLYLPGGARDRALEPILISANGYDYSPAFERAERAVSDFLADPQPPLESTATLLARLDRSPRSEQEAVIAADHLFANSEVVKRMIERSHDARYDDPEAMLHWATLARLVAERCIPDSLGSEARLHDLRARAWSQYGNSLRVAGHLTEAQKAMGVAKRYLQIGTHDPALRARLFEQVASLHTFQRDFGDAISLLQEAAEIYRELGETHSLARSLVKEAIAHLYSGEPESAVGILNRAIPLIDHESDPHLLLAACHNIVRCYIDLDQPEQALSLYLDAQELYSEFKDALILLRASWQQGQLLRDMGHLHAAETTLLRARRGFMERDLAYEVAVVSLDLASVYVRLGATRDLKQTVSETVPIFRALRVDREVLASLLQLQKIADQEHQALELIRALTAQLKSLGRPAEDEVS